MKLSTYFLAFTIPLSITLTFWVQSWFSGFAVIYAFGILPLLELVLPEVKVNDTLSLKPSNNSNGFDFLLRMMVPVQWSLWIWFMEIISSSGTSFYEKVGLTLSMGIGCGVLGINVAHELGHRKSTLDRWLSRALLLTSLYWQNYIEHNQGHHRNVATPMDPESSHLNESLYRFWFRAIRDTFIHSFKIDRHEMILGLLTQLLLILGVGMIWGSSAVIGFIGAALMGILLLQSVNYIEHYGLVRAELLPGQYEKVSPKHSWNADHFLSRAILFDLSRHSDHHAYVTRKYYELRHHPESPQMPTGYPGMILLALVPPLWFRFMNPKVQEWMSDSSTSQSI